MSELTVALFGFLLRVCYSYRSRHCNRPLLTRPTGSPSSIVAPGLLKPRVSHPFYPFLGCLLAIESLLSRLQFVFQQYSTVFLVDFLSQYFHSNLLKYILRRSEFLILKDGSDRNLAVALASRFIFISYIFVGTTFRT